MTDTFEIHDHRHELKQLRDSGDTKLFENRDGLSCPVCGTAFRRLLMTANQAVQFPENDGSRFCILRQPTEIVVFRH
ncbi:MAG: flagella cluster protein [Halorubrum sp.]|uniref:DUF7385 family protein n=1 Tax=Haloferacaceae TaxID=1644056 RepID=UPI0010FB293B|nr:flagella cluster protein [Halalkalirubrum salinum]